MQGCHFNEEVYNLSSPRSLGVEVVNSLSDHCAICMTRDSPKLPQPGLLHYLYDQGLPQASTTRTRGANSLDDFCAILYDQDHTRPSPLGP